MPYRTHFLVRHHETLVDQLASDAAPAERAASLFATVDEALSLLYLDAPIDDMADYPDTYQLRTSPWTLVRSSRVDHYVDPDLSRFPMSDRSARLFAMILEVTLLHAAVNAELNHAESYWHDDGYPFPIESDYDPAYELIEQLHKRTTLGSLLWRTRTAANLSAREVGDRLGVAGKTVSRWENGDTAPDQRMVDRFADALDIPQDMVLGAQRGYRDGMWRDLPSSRSLDERRAPWRRTIEERWCPRQHPCPGESMF